MVQCLGLISPGMTQHHLSSPLPRWKSSIRPRLPVTTFSLDSVYIHLIHRVAFNVSISPTFILFVLFTHQAYRVFFLCRKAQCYILGMLKMSKIKTLWPMRLGDLLYRDMSYIHGTFSKYLYTVVPAFQKTDK